MRFALALLAAILLAACAREPRVQSSTTDVVTVRFFEGEQDAADKKASDECARYNKHSRLRTINTENTGDRVAIYDCLPN